MTTRRKARWLTVLQICAIPVFLGSGFCAVQSLAARPRARAVTLTDRHIPADWEWVVFNHGEVHRWPHPKLLAIVSFAGCAVSGIFLVLSGLSFQAWRLDGRRGVGLS